MKRDWMQIVGVAAIVLGLALVLVELRQSLRQVDAQLKLDDYLSIFEHQYTLMGDNPAASIAKARTTPEQLTDEEKIIVNAHLRVEYERVAAYEYIWNSTGVFGEGWEEVIPDMLEEFFNYQYAQAWITEHQRESRTWNPDLPEFVNAALKE